MPEKESWFTRMKDRWEARVEANRQAARMIRALFVSLALALALQALAPDPARAVTEAECEAWLCLPGGFPPSECTPAEIAVKRRLAAFQPPLPPWSSCAAAFGWDMAVMDYTQRDTDSCPNGGAITNGECRGRASNGCPYSYPPQRAAWVQVSVDGSTGFQPNTPHTQVTRQAGSRVGTDPLCPTPPPPPVVVSGRCPVGWHFYRYLTADGVTWAEVCLEHPVAPVN